MSNKGKQLRLCRQCGKKRYCTKVTVPNVNYRFTCSKGHTWTIAGVTIERVTLAIQQFFTEARLEAMFEKDDIFFKRFHGR